MNLVRYAAAHILQMQKALAQMNLQLANVVSDITGVTGMCIIRAVLRLRCMSEYMHKKPNVSILIYHIVRPDKYRRVVFDEKVQRVVRDSCLEISYESLI